MGRRLEYPPSPAVLAPLGPAASLGNDHRNPGVTRTMNHPTPSTADPRALPSAPTPPPARVRVWDPFVRLFHWGLGAAVLLAFLTEDAFLGLHTGAGYAVLILIGARLIWGLIGPHHARWASCVRGPGATLAYLRTVLRGHPPRYLGHNPAGAAMALALMTGFGLTALTGVAVLGAGELAGPLAPLLQGVSSATAHDLKEVHEFLAWATLALVPLHLLGTALSSLQHRENLVRGMIDGYKRNDEA